MILHLLHANMLPHADHAGMLAQHATHSQLCYAFHNFFDFAFTVPT